MVIQPGFLPKAVLWPVALYAGFVLVMIIPAFQKHFVFLHKVQFPLFAKYDHPEKYGLAPFKVRNLRLTTEDGVGIGAWHILPEEFYQNQIDRQSQNSEDLQPFSDSVFDDALKRYPTIIYLHGNAANRAAPFRVQTYSHLTSRIATNVVAIDYRGFGDSDGDPSEDGLVNDARAAWDWVLNKTGRTDGSGITLFGQSLGTGVASKLTLQLQQQAGIPPHAIVLMAPYSSLIDVVKDFRIAGLVPILAPITFLPFHEIKTSPPMID